MLLCGEIALNLYKEAIQPKLAARSFTIDGSTRQSRALLFASQQAKERTGGGAPYHVLGMATTVTLCWPQPRPA